MKSTMTAPHRYSVVIPLYNKQGTISRTIDSILAQGHEVEVIVVDDGSTDDGPRLVQEMASPFLRLVRQPNLGVSAARNKGISEASNELVALLDADDEWLPGFLDEIDALVQAFPGAGAYATSFQYVHGGRAVPKRPNSQLTIPYRGVPDFFSCVRERELFCTSSIVLRRSVFQGIGGFQEDMWYGEDTDAWVRLALNSSIAYSSEVGSSYHQDPSGRAMKLRRPITRHFIDSVVEHMKTDALVSEDLLSFANRHLCLVVLRNNANGYHRQALELLSRRPSDKDLAFIALCYLLSVLPSPASALLHRIWEELRTGREGKVI